MCLPRLRTRCVGLVLFGALSAAPARAQVVETDDHITARIAEGVYAIRHKRAARIGALSGNTTVVIGEREVLVVDSCLLPSIARDDIALIKQWTSKPVRYLVNTHWHGDHTWGNSLYAETFPGLRIVGHSETAREMLGYLPNFLERNRNGSAELERVLASGKTESGVPLTEAQRSQMEAEIPRAEERAVEYKTFETRPPDLTFETELSLDIGNREVEIRHLGRGNTAGDAIVYLPRERIVVAGDLVVYPFPFLIGGFPTASTGGLPGLITSAYREAWGTSGERSRIHFGVAIRYRKRQHVEAVGQSVFDALKGGCGGCGAAPPE